MMESEFNLAVFNSTALAESPLSPCEPLWKRVPTSDSEGRKLGDFMMLIPKLRNWPRVRMERAVREIHGVFEHYREAVVFADLNLKLNLLWVSVKPIPGICLEVAGAVRSRVPEAILVANLVEVMAGARRTGWTG